MWVRKTEKEIANANQRKIRSDFKAALIIAPLIVILMSIDPIVEGDLTIDDIKRIDPLYVVGFLIFLTAVVFLSSGFKRMPKWMSSPKPIYSPISGARMTDGLHGSTLICTSCHEVQVDESQDGCRSCSGKLEPSIYWKEVDEE